MSKPKIKAGIVGAAGYTGGELLRLLLHHPLAEIVFAHSRSHAGQAVTSVHPDLLGDTDLVFSGTIEPDADVIFLCLGHGESAKWLHENRLAEKTKLIDLSQDFRLAVKGNDFVYGLPEFQREKIAKAKHIANPGCFATAIQLALLPLAKEGLLKEEIQIVATTGSTGAGQALSASSHFTWRYGNHSAYKTLEHQHLAEIGETLQQCQASNTGALHFIPQRGAFTRGILAVLHFPSALSTATANALFKAYYQTHPFTHVSQKPVDLKQVINTNKCFLHLEVIHERLVITAAIDNLLKGASGQAVQNMNLLFGCEESTGLHLKPLAY